MDILEFILDWPQMYEDVHKFVQICGVCQVAKGVSQNIGFYTPIIVLEKLWIDISMDFVLELPKIQRGVILYLLSWIDFLRCLIL